MFRPRRAPAAVAVLEVPPAIAEPLDEDERQVVPEPLVRCAACGVGLREGDGVEAFGVVLCLDDARRELRGTAAGEEIERAKRPRRSSCR